MVICVNGEGPGTLLENLVFTNGINTYGGALTCVKSSPRLRFCVFFKNRSVLEGGAVFMTSGAAPDFYQCLFIENECSGFAGGAIAATIASQPVFTGCDFVGNQSAGYGAAVYLGEASATFDGCDFIGNATLVSGGAMQLLLSGTLMR